MFLDVVSIIPGVGAVAAVVNSALYLAEGDYVNSALSAAAAIPLGGAAVALGAKAGIKAAVKIGQAIKATKSAKTALKVIQKESVGKKIISKAKAIGKSLKNETKKIAEKAKNKTPYSKKTVSKTIKTKLKKLIKKDNGKYKTKAKKELKNYAKKFWPFTKKVPPNGFAKWQDSEKYLQKFVGGKPQSFRTADEKLRKVDAYAKEIAHEAKMGYVSLTKFVKEQIDKDIALIAEMKIKGAEWHFFKSGKTGKIGPSKGLRTYLENNGIKVVIHK